jgi:hypothetical protein
MSGEIAKTLHTKLWALRLNSKNDVNKHINDFTLYMDQLEELGREEREETLVDLFLDSIIDPRFEVTIANCWLREYITLQECFEAVRKYDNIILRDELGDKNKLKIRRNSIKDGTPETNKVGSNNLKINTGYKSYKEWQKLSPEERSAIIKAREEERGKNSGRTSRTPKRKVNFLGVPNSGHEDKDNNNRKVRRLHSSQVETPGDGESKPEDEE